MVNLDVTFLREVLSTYLGKRERVFIHLWEYTIAYDKRKPPNQILKCVCKIMLSKVGLHVICLHIKTKSPSLRTAFI